MTVGVDEGTARRGRRRGCAVTIAAAPVSPRIWAAMTRFARGNRPLEAGVEGREQSVHLEHLMTRTGASRSSRAPHALALQPARAASEARASTSPRSPTRSRDEIDRDPSLLLRWRGCETQEVLEPPDSRPHRSIMPGDAWQAGPLPEPRPLRPLPAGVVLKRLGPSGLRIGGSDLAEVLQPGVRIVRSLTAPLVLDARAPRRATARWRRRAAMSGSVARDDQDLARSAAACRHRHCFLDLADVVGGVNRRVQLALGDEPGDLAEERSTLTLGRASGTSWRARSRAGSGFGRRRRLAAPCRAHRSCGRS